MNSIIITRAGTHSTIQDFGRFQYQHLGVSPSGAMDQRIITELQKIIPNHQNQFLEFAYVGPSIKVKETLNSLIKKYNLLLKIKILFSNIIET